MRIFTTGASGWIGSAAVAELIASGHTVEGLARSRASAQRLTAARVDVRRGELTDLDVLAAGARAADAVLHLGFVHDFTNYAAAGAIERAAVETFGDALEGTRKTLVVASGTGIIGLDHPVTENDPSPQVGPDSLRGGSENLALSFDERGIRPVVVRFSPTVHGLGGDHGFISTLARVGRERGLIGYIGDGQNRWNAVHRGDAGRLVRLALERRAAGNGLPIVHAVGESALTTRSIAEALGAANGIPVGSIDPADADEHFGWISRFWSFDVPASSEITRTKLSWTPTGATLFDDIAGGGYPGW